MGAATVTPTTRVKPSAPSLRRCIIANDCTRLWPIGRPPSSKKIYHAAGLLRSSPAAWSAQLVSPRAHPWHLTQPVPNFRCLTPGVHSREINRDFFIFEALVLSSSLHSSTKLNGLHRNSLLLPNRDSFRRN